ncbi:MAG TPA: MCE family protein [Longimicrobiales bacterium]|nr:MCE family protein [Longimicrobiales bacterium]
MALIALAAAFIFNLEAVYDVAGDRMDLVAVLPDASGVRVGTPVRVAGVEKGRVAGIAFLAAGDSARVALLIRLEGDARTVIRKDSDVWAMRLQAIGQPLVQIKAGSPGSAPVRSGDTLYGAHRLDPALLLEGGMDLPAAIDSLLTTARRVQAMAEARESELERLQRRMDAATAAATALAADLDGGSLSRLLGPGGAMDGIARLQERLAALSAAVETARERYGGGAEGGGLPRSLAGLGARVALLQADLDALDARMRAGGGFLYRMPRDSALQVAITGVQAQIDSLRQEASSLVLRMVLP